MGVPSFFRWLCQRFPKIVIDVIENETETIDGVQVPVDTSAANPNQTEFDCLYLDMNGIIHPCTHPEDGKPPLSEEDMMISIMEYVDRMFSMVRPRKLLMLAIDGVAPRAKMNQQRSRRFKAKKAAKDEAKKKEELRKKGLLDDEGPALGSNFDSNCITPGTEFMEKVANYLRYYVSLKQNTDPGWKNIKVILSDSNVPGEGEHKIMEFIRYQRAQKDYDPNMRHVICGLDADLIMLGLATHEPHFSIISETVTQNSSGCFKCGQLGHIASECKGKPRELDENLEEKPVKKTPFQFLHLHVLREYLDRTLFCDNLTFEYEFERALDDFIFLCFFVGNDFLPHLPTLEIRENALDLLIRIYKDIYPKTGYLTESGELYLDRIDPLVTEISKLEDSILQNRAKRQQQREEREKYRKEQDKYKNTSHEIQDDKNVSAAAHLRSFLQQEEQSPAVNNNHSSLQLDNNNNNNNNGGSQRKRKEPETSEDQTITNDEENAKEEIVDHIRLGESGWKARYYKQKFNVEMDNVQLFQSLKQSYVEGLMWVYRYYYKGCCSWKWFYPFHFAPFASEIMGLKDIHIQFNLGEPFSPLEQLMSVLPADSCPLLPTAYQQLMTSPQSPIIDYYPLDFEVEKDKNKPEWTWVALLPFIDEQRLLPAIKTVENTLTPEEKDRNSLRNAILFIDSSNQLVASMNSEEWISIDQIPSFFGFVRLFEGVLKRDSIPSPRSSSKFQPIQKNSVVMLEYRMPPLSSQTLIFGLLKGAIPPPFVLSEEDFAGGRERDRGYYKTQNSAAARMINHSIQGRQNKMPHHVQERYAHQPHPYNRPRDHRGDNQDRDNRNYDYNRQSYQNRDKNSNNYYHDRTRDDSRDNYYNRPSGSHSPTPGPRNPSSNPNPQPFVMNPIPFGAPLPSSTLSPFGYAPTLPSLPPSGVQVPARINGIPLVSQAPQIQFQHPQQPYHHNQHAHHSKHNQDPRKRKH